MGMRKMHKKTTNQDINNLIQHALKKHINQKPAKLKKATQNPKQIEEMETRIKTLNLTKPHNINIITKTHEKRNTYKRTREENNTMRHSGKE